jgi:hypothetical protein
MIDGYGYYKFGNGLIYEGDFRNGKRYGKGYLKNIDEGWEYIGEFSDN